MMAWVPGETSAGIVTAAEMFAPAPVPSSVPAAESKRNWTGSVAETALEW